MSLLIILHTLLDYNICGWNNILIYALRGDNGAKDGPLNGKNRSELTEIGRSEPHEPSEDAYFYILFYRTPLMYDNKDSHCLSLSKLSKTKNLLALSVSTVVKSKH